MDSVVLDKFWIKCEVIDCKPDQALIIDVYLERIHACHKNIYSEVKLASSDKVGVGDVSLNKDTFISIRNIFRIINHKYSGPVVFA